MEINLGPGSALGEKGLKGQQWWRVGGIRPAKFPVFMSAFFGERDMSNWHIHKGACPFSQTSKIEREGLIN